MSAREAGVVGAEPEEVAVEDPAVGRDRLRDRRPRLFLGGEDPAGPPEQAVEMDDRQSGRAREGERDVRLSGTAGADDRDSLHG